MLVRCDGSLGVGELTPFCAKELLLLEMKSLRVIGVRALVEETGLSEELLVVLFLRVLCGLLSNLCCSMQDLKAFSFAADISVCSELAAGPAFCFERRLVLSDATAFLLLLWLTV